MEIINSPTKVLETMTNCIDGFKFKFDYKILDETYLNDIVTFINENYVNKDGSTTSLIYSEEIIKHYLIDSIPIFFYGKNNPNKIISLIIGRVANVSVNNIEYGAIEVNFFCIIPPLRKMDLPKLFKAYLIRECIKKYGDLIKFAYYTTNDKINVKPICKKNYIHRCINFDQLKKLNIISETRSTSLYKKLYSKFIYPEKFKSYKILHNVEPKDYKDIINKINSYQKDNFDIYEVINQKTLEDIFKSNVFEKFIIENNGMIEGFISFFKLDIISKKYEINNICKTIYLNYYFVNGNIIEYLEFIGEYMKQHMICDMFLTNLFDDSDKIPDRFFQGSGTLYYNLWNVTPFSIKEHKVRLIMM